MNSVQSIPILLQKKASDTVQPVAVECGALGQVGMHRPITRPRDTQDLSAHITHTITITIVIVIKIVAAVAIVCLPVHVGGPDGNGGAAKGVQQCAQIVTECRVAQYDVGDEGMGETHGLVMLWDFERVSPLRAQRLRACDANPGVVLVEAGVRLRVVVRR